jgi:DNA-binding response OmpR family regulator
MPATRVLVIEDDASIRELISTLLDPEGYQVLASGSDVDPVDVSQLRPALVLLDLWLGGSPRGWDFLLAIKETPAARCIPVLVCTADSTWVKRETVRLAELAAGVILKPFDIDDLVARVTAIVPPLSLRGHRTDVAAEIW